MSEHVTVAAPTLRCHSCSHAVGVTATQMRIVGLFKPSLVGKVPRSHSYEIRRRCSSCGWVNVFHPMTTGREFETK